MPNRRATWNVSGNVLVVKSGRGLSVIGPKNEENQQVTADQNWGGGNHIITITIGKS